MEKHNPNWVNNDLQLPKDRQTSNAWARAFFALNPIVSSTIEFYSEVPLNYLKIEPTGIDEVDQFWDEQKEIVNLDNVLNGALKELWLFGEVFLYLNMDELNARWSSILIQNPDYVIVKRDLAGNSHISLRPDERLRDAVIKEKTEELKEISPEVISAIKNGKNIELNDFYVAHLVTKLNSYEVRGTSPLTSVMGLLMQADSLRKYASNKEVKEIEDKIKQAILYPYDKHNSITRNAIITKVTSRMNLLTDWLKKKYFTPIAKINDFYKIENGVKKLIIPIVHFNRKGFKDSLSA